MHMSKNTSPPSPSVRVTVPVTPEVRDTFKRLAKAGRTSTGRAMGDWLGDTIDAAAYMAKTMEKAREAPRIVAQELHAYALGLSDETGELLRQIRAKGGAGQHGDGHAPAGPGAGLGGSPPSCNTGGKGTTKPHKTQGGRL